MNQITPPPKIEITSFSAPFSDAQRQGFENKLAARPGFDTLPAVRGGWLREIKSPLILQPGPAALTDGLAALIAIVDEWTAAQGRSFRPATTSAR